MVFDLGGGTLDVTLMDMSSAGGDATFEVVATSGDTQLGGTDMDNALIEFVAGEFRKETGIDLTKDKLAMTRLKESVEKAKIELSTVLETELNLPFITADASGPKHLTQKLTRSKLEGIVKPIIDRCKGILPSLSIGQVGIKQCQIKLDVQRLFVKLSRQIHARFGRIDVAVEI